ncbi:exported hypothetical protein [Vibrio nigripulchritudo BLFn1]|nr:exported hypothetical protein [Vibrio nigripulchritudo BLFn1]
MNAAAPASVVATVTFVVASVKIEPKSKSAVLEIETGSSTTILEVKVSDAAITPGAIAAKEISASFFMDFIFITPSPFILNNLIFINTFLHY